MRRSRSSNSWRRRGSARARRRRGTAAMVMRSRITSSLGRLYR